MTPKRIWTGAEYKFSLTNSGHRYNRNKTRLLTTYEIDVIKVNIYQGKSGNIEIQGKIADQSAATKMIQDLKLVSRKLPAMQLRELEPYGQDWSYGCNFVASFHFDGAPDHKKMSVDQVVDIWYEKLTGALGVTDISPHLEIQESFCSIKEGRYVSREEDFTNRFLRKKKFPRNQTS